MEISCKTCIHKKVCDLWREKECQSAKSFFDDECELYAAERKKGKWNPICTEDGIQDEYWHKVIAWMELPKPYEEGKDET